MPPIYAKIISGKRSYGFAETKDDVRYYFSADAVRFPGISDVSNYIGREIEVVAFSENEKGIYISRCRLLNEGERHLNFSEEEWNILVDYAVDQGMYCPPYYKYKMFPKKTEERGLAEVLSVTRVTTKYSNNKESVSIYADVKWQNDATEKIVLAQEELIALSVEIQEIEKVVDSPLGNHGFGSPWGYKEE